MKGGQNGEEQRERGGERKEIYGHGVRQRRQFASQPVNPPVLSLSPAVRPVNP